MLNRSKKVLEFIIGRKCPNDKIGAGGAGGGGGAAGGGRHYTKEIDLAWKITNSRNFLITNSRNFHARSCPPFRSAREIA